MPHQDFNNYDGFIDTNIDLLMTIALAAISIIAIYAAYVFSTILLMLILLPCMLLWFMLLREWLIIISIKSPRNWRWLINATGFLLLPYLATYLNGGPAFTLRWAKIQILSTYKQPWNWGNGPLNSNEFVVGLFLISCFIMFVTYMKRSRRSNQEGWTPCYPLLISLYLSLIALFYSHIASPVYMEMIVAPAFLISVVIFNFSFLISYILSPHIIFKRLISSE